MTIIHLSFMLACLNTTCLLSINRTYVLSHKIFAVFPSLVGEKYLV